MVVHGATVRPGGRVVRCVADDHSRAQQTVHAAVGTVVNVDAVDGVVGAQVELPPVSARAVGLPGSGVVRVRAGVAAVGTVGVAIDAAVGLAAPADGGGRRGAAAPDAIGPGAPAAAHVGGIDVAGAVGNAGVEGAVARVEARGDVLQVGRRRRRRCGRRIWGLKARRRLVGAAPHCVTDVVLPALRRAQAGRYGAFIRAGLIPAVTPSLRGQVTGVACLACPHLLGVVLATGAASLVGLQFRDRAQPRSDRLADGCRMRPSVGHLVSALGRVLAALAGIVARVVRGELAQTIVGLCADIDVVGGGAGVVQRPAAVQGVELGARLGGAAGAVAVRRALRPNQHVNVRAAADGHVGVVVGTALVAYTLRLAGALVTPALHAAAIASTVVAAERGGMTSVTRLGGPHKLEVVLAP